MGGVVHTSETPLLKIRYQDALRNPTGWLEIEAEEWAGLPKRPLPLPAQLGGQNNTPGWVRNVNVQGLTCEGQDHVAIEPVIIGLDVGVKLTTWNDDPDDYPVGQRTAHVWTILPLAPDPALGMAINTRQSAVWYHEGERYEWFLERGSPRNVTVRPWSEFVPPPDAITRHGVWLTDAKHAEHVDRAPHSDWGWMHWCDHLPDTEVALDARGRRVLREQRAQGRYRQSERTITYYQRNTDRAQGWIVATHEDALELTTDTSATESVTVGSGVATICWAFATPAAAPGSTNWDGVYHTQYNVSALSVGVTWQQANASVGTTAAWARLASDLASILQGEIEVIGIQSGSGLVLLTSGTATWTSPAATDRLGFPFTAIGDSMTDAITLTLNTTDSYADGPWTTGSVQYLKSLVRSQAVKRAATW